jgi:hypothetical protein
LGSRVSKGKCFYIQVHPSARIPRKEAEEEEEEA